MIRLGDYIYKKVKASDVLEWPVFKDEAERAEEEVKNVFALGGGELEDESWAGYRYWYEGPPHYVGERDLGVHPYGGEFRTVIGFAGSPEEELEGVWEYITSFTHSGESDCWFCGHGLDDDSWAEGFEDAHGQPPRDSDRCGLCETDYADQPGYVYIGSAYEAVYRLVEKEDWMEEEDY